MFPNSFSALDPQRLQEMLQGTTPPEPRSRGARIPAGATLSWSPDAGAPAARQTASGPAAAASRAPQTITPPTVAPPESIFRMASPEAVSAHRNAPDERGFFGGPKASAANFSPEGFMPGFVRMNPMAPAGAATDVFASNPMEYMLAMQRAGMNPSVMNQFMETRGRESAMGLDAGKANAELGLRAQTLPLELQNRLDLAGMQGQAQRDVANIQSQGQMGRDLSKMEQDIRGAMAVAGTPNAQHVEALRALNEQRLAAGLPPISLPQLPPPAPPPEPFWSRARRGAVNSPLNIRNWGIPGLTPSTHFGRWLAGEE